MVDSVGVVWTIDAELDSTGTRVVTTIRRGLTVVSVLRLRFSAREDGRLLTARTEWYENGRLARAMDLSLGALTVNDVGVIASALREVAKPVAEAFLPKVAHAQSTECLWIALKMLGCAGSGGATCTAAVMGIPITVGGSAVSLLSACLGSSACLIDSYYDWMSTCAEPE